MSETRWKGSWWLPASPDETRPGTLHYDDQGDLRLELIGGFDTYIRTPIPGGEAIGLGDGRFPVIHGSSGDEEFTLLGCIASHTSSGLGLDVTDQTIEANAGLRGILVEDADEKAFDSMDLQLEYLLPWSAQTSMRAEIDRDPIGRWSGSQTATSTPTENRSAAYENLTFTLRVQHTMFRFEMQRSGNKRTIESHEVGVLEIESTEPASLNDFNSTAKALQDLLTLAAFAPSAVLERSLWYLPASAHSHNADRPKEVSVMGSLVYKPGTRPKDDPSSDYLFTLADIEFGDLVPAWLAIYKSAWLPCSMLFGTEYQSPGYVGAHLFAVASAAEGIHRALHDRTAMANDEFERGLNKVLSALAGEENKPFRVLVREQLHNNLSYRERLLELAEIPDQEAVQMLLPNINQWVKLLKNVRNGTAHADDSLSGARPEPELVFWLAKISYVLLCLVLMAELNVSAEVQRRAVQTPEIAHAIDKFRLASTAV